MGEQEVAPLTEVDPVAQEVQIEEPTVLADDPIAQGVQTEDPGDADEPTGQIEQGDLILRLKHNLQYKFDKLH